MKKLTTKKMWEILEWYRYWENEKQMYMVKASMFGLTSIGYMPFDDWLKDQVMGGIGKKIYEEVLEK